MFLSCSNPFGERRGSTNVTKKDHDADVVKASLSQAARHLRFPVGESLVPLIANGFRIPSVVVARFGSCSKNAEARSLQLVNGV